MNAFGRWCNVHVVHECHVARQKHERYVSAVQNYSRSKTERGLNWATLKRDIYIRHLMTCQDCQVASREELTQFLETDIEFIYKTQRDFADYFWRCPRCDSEDVKHINNSESALGMRWEYVCNDCGLRYYELAGIIGYKIKEEQSEDEKDKQKD